MDKQDIAIEIYEELDTMRRISLLCRFAIENSAPDMGIDHLDVIFRDVYRRSLRISEMVEILERFDDPMFPESLKTIPEY
jgi:hypothetical protein